LRRREQAIRHSAVESRPNVRPLFVRAPRATTAIPAPAKDDMGLIKPDELAFRLDLSPAELKLTYSALKALLN